MGDDRVEEYAQLESLRARLFDAEQRAEALAADRDWWMRQHDEVMNDWRADLVQFAEARSKAAQAAPEPDVTARALHRLMRFFDAKTGLIHVKVGDELLFDAFADAERLIGWVAVSVTNVR